MKIDTEIRHVTKPGANLFLELGFTPAEAKRLQAASRKQINDTRLLKQQLGRAVCLDCETSLKASRGRRDPNGFAPACVRRGEQENSQVHNRYARGNAQPRRKAGQAGDPVINMLRPGEVVGNHGFWGASSQF